MTVLVGIDGTGPVSDREYARDFRGSFVRYICNHFPTPPRAHYIPGPRDSHWDLHAGSTTTDLAEEGYYFARSRRGDEDILLTGYSRGAAAVVAVAMELHEARIPVAAMMLFDCVDRNPTLNTRIIPPNVAEVIHVTRDPRAESRESFSNSGTHASSPTIYNGVRQTAAFSRGTRVRFMGTHGAMGGVPWHWSLRGGEIGGRYVYEGDPDGVTTITYAEDLACSTRVWNFVRGSLRHLGFIRG